MSNSPEPSPQRPTLANKPLRKLKEILISPYGVAAIASLSFHAVLFTAIPRFSSASFAAFDESDVPGEPRTVPLVTLSPAEQGRLPDFNPPQLPKIPDISSRSSINKLPDASALNRSNIFNRSSSNRITTPSFPSFSSSSQLRRNRPFRNPYIPRPNLSIIDTPSRSQSSDRRTASIDDIPNPPPDNASEIDTGADTLARELALEQAATAEQAEGLSALPEQPSDLTTVSEDEVSDVAVNSETGTPLTRLERLQAKFKYDATDTDEDAVDVRYAEWLTEATGSDSSETLETANIQALDPIASGLSLCVENPPSAGKVGILIAPDGTSSEPTVLLSTGYTALNQAVLEGLANNQDALKELINSEFPETETAVPYVFEFPVDYDAENCKNSQDVLEAAQSSQSNSSEDSDSSEE